MRIHFKTTGTNELVPFSYQEEIVRCLYKWIGKNDFHDKISNYSFSLLSDAKVKGDKLSFKYGTSWFFSSWNNEMIKKIVAGVKYDPVFIYGMKIKEIVLEQTPDLRKIHKFFLASPVLIKRSIGNKIKFYYYSDDEAPNLLKETITNKMKSAGLSIDPSLEIHFDDSYMNPKIKKFTYKGIDNKASLCPVIITGKPETKSFIWNVGLGNSTGIGFGSIK